MTRDETAAGGATLEARVATQTLYLMEMMRRLGVPSRAAQDEADRAARIEAEALCAACGEKDACSAFLAGVEPVAAPPAFCANGGWLDRRRG